MKPANSRSGRYSTISQSAGSASAAVASLVRSTQSFPLGLSGRAAEAALPLLEERQRLEELALAEVRPERVGDVQLGVSELPEEEVADPHLSAGADEKVGIGDAGRAEVLGKHALSDALRIELTPRYPAGDRTDRAHDVVAPAVAHGERDGHARVVARRRDRLAQRSAHRRGQPAQVADREQADVMLHHLAELALQVAAQQRHEAVDLARRAVPVLAREREQREVLDAQPPARLHHRAHRLLAGTVPVEARKAALLRPAAVAVHDDGDVARQPRGIDLDHQTAMISSSLVLSSFSTRSMASLVSASIFSAACRRSSSVISRSFSRSLSSSRASRRWLRVDTR